MRPTSADFVGGLLLLIATASCVEESKAGDDKDGSHHEPDESDAEVAHDAASTDAAAWDGPVPTVCDGSERIRLRYRVLDDAARFGPGAFLPFQNGAAFWLITGECDYYVQDVVATGRLGVFSGTLDPSEAQAMGRRVHFGEPLESALFGDGQVLDASIHSIWKRSRWAAKLSARLRL
jgi:hypothetical protein